jgi:hypothetical protein
MSLRPVVRAAFLAYTHPLEGTIASMYRCVSNKVTIALGVVVEPVEVAQRLAFFWPDGRPATREEIAAAWQVVKTTPGLDADGWPAAAKLTPLRISPAEIERLTWERLDRDMLSELVKRFPAFPSWCASAQLAVVSLAWACGPDFAYPKLEAFLRAEDFVGASTECAINRPPNPKRSAAQKALFLQAAAGGDPDALTLPWLAPPPESPTFTALDREALLADLSASLADSAEAQRIRDRDAHYRDD